MATGEQLKLENYQGEWGMPFYVGDSARTAQEREEIRLYNQLVNAVLRKKRLAQPGMGCQEGNRLIAIGEKSIPC